MGQHKGLKYKDRKCKQRYWSESHRRQNKMRRILRCNGQAYLDWWTSKY